MKIRGQLLIGLFLLVAILLLEKYTNWDISLQNLFYDTNTKQWLISRTLHQQLSIFFYKGFKTLVIAVGILCLVGFVASYKWALAARFRREMLLMFLSIVLVPGVIAGSKQFTDVYCPRQLEIYGGEYPMVRVLDPYPADFVMERKGLCFPAGHATAGFALMMLYFCFKSPKRRRAALGVAITLGWVTGTYQMLRGEHFLSHTLFTMVAAWMIIICINYIVTIKLKIANETP